MYIHAEYVNKFLAQCKSSGK